MVAIGRPYLGRGAAAGRPRSGAPLAVRGPALLVGLAMLLPLVYLAVRSAGATGDAWGLLIDSRTLQTLGRTVLLMVTVTAGSAAIALPLAWLTVRTDLPLRRAWSVVVVLPLVVPSFIGAFLYISAFGPRGMLQQALESLLGIQRIPELYGLVGATLTLSLLSYPYLLLTVRGAWSSLDPSSEESARSLGHGPWSTMLRVTLPQLWPAITAGSLLVSLYTLSDFGAVSLMRYPTFTWVILPAVRVLLRPLRGGRALPGAGGPGRGRPRAGGVDPGASALLPLRAGLPPTASHGGAGQVEVAGAAVLLRRGRPLPGAAHGHPGPVAGAGSADGRADAVPVVGDPQLRGRLRHGRGGRRRPINTPGGADGQVPRHPEPPDGAGRLRRLRPSGRRGRPVVGLLRGQLRTAPVPDRLAAGLRLRRPPAPGGPGGHPRLPAPGEPAAGGGGARVGQDATDRRCAPSPCPW